MKISLRACGLFLSCLLNMKAFYFVRGFGVLSMSKDIHYPTFTIETETATTLLVASSKDPASCVMSNTLLKMGHWEEVAPGAQGGGQAWVHMKAGRRASGVALWRVDVPLLGLDDPDCRWTEGGESRSKPMDVLFLSKHVAASGRPALCVHPIGLPDPACSREWGGMPGKCPPPSPRIAGCLRELQQACKEANLDSTFEVTLEVTHHGPYLQTPAMFVEIGSSEEHWERQDAANVWAVTISRMLGLDGVEGQKTWASLDAAERGEQTAFVGLGGGHYAPRHGDVARQEGRYMGHMLASYALNFGPGGGWKEAVVEAIGATRLAYPGVGCVAAHVDKKSFKSADRSQLVSYLEELGVDFRMRTVDC
ncbi:unnamed protein product [Choristocarpus tenellus]